MAPNGRADESAQGPGNKPAAPSRIPHCTSLRSWESTLCESMASATGTSRGSEDIADRDDASSVASLPGSDAGYRDPSQTLIVLDWDDTLFPTGEFIDRWGVKCPEEGQYEPADEAQARALQDWREALTEFIEVACILSDRCVIITNSRRPWVSDCLDRFAPDLKPLFERSAKAPRVVYTNERLRPTRFRASQCMNLRPVKDRHLDLTQVTPEEVQEECTHVKYNAMKQEAAAFYASYPNQSWKNILSIGDMPFERDALQELAFRRVAPSRERLRAKAVVERTTPSISELALRLRCSAALLPAYVAFDGDLDLNFATMSEQEDPLAATAAALWLPEIADVPISRHAWGRGEAPTGEEEVEKAERAVLELAVLVHREVFG
mmetsp:Transcript_23330/g.66890  ORF Transcript_23330/g.66890 Transcript_23330/m.66890 type:complete len:379 (-) Transcript_23330:77-1213(-)